MKRALALTVSVAIVALASASIARPGGGGSFSGGSRSGSSSSSSGSRSGSSSSSSGSSYRSGSSSSSSGSTYRSTSSSSSSSGSTSAPEPAPVYLTREGNFTDRKDLGTPPPKTKAMRPEPWPPPNELDMSIGVAFILGGLITALAVIGLVVYLLARSMKRHAGAGWSTQQPVAVHGRAELDAIRATDPDFSIALFEDFLYALYTEVHVARGAQTLERLAPYVRTNARQSLTQRTMGPVSDVVVGAMRFQKFHARDPGRWGVVVEFESNYTEGQRAYWATERWTLWRARGAKSRPPERARVLACPNCGAPLEKVIGGTCRHCNSVVDQGNFDWIVESIGVVAIEPRGPMLTGTTEEQGTDLPTLVDPALRDRLGALSNRDRAFSMPALEARVGLVFSTMQLAWSSLEWQRARPFLSDNLWETQRYWIEAYRKSGLRNVTERTRILRIDPARLTQDKWFDAITLRVYATGLDFTLRVADNQVVGGDRSKERTYSEYWTFLRGTSATGTARSDHGCPSCGAPLAVTMAGNCTHCNVKVNSGAFDWVLARIEQDEVYTG